MAGIFGGQAQAPTGLSPFLGLNSTRTPQAPPLAPFPVDSAALLTGSLGTCAPRQGSGYAAGALGAGLAWLVLFSDEGWTISARQYPPPAEQSETGCSEGGHYVGLAICDQSEYHWGGSPPAASLCLPLSASQGRLVGAGLK